MSAGLGLSATVAGVLTTLPVLVFALVGPLAPRLAARIGLRGGALVTLVVVGTALLARAFSEASWLFVALDRVGPGRGGHRQRDPAPAGPAVLPGPGWR